MVTLDSPICIAPEVLAQEVQGDSVLLHLGTESYFGLNLLGTLVWQRLAAGMPLRRIYDQLLAEYAVGAAPLEQDLLDLVTNLSSAGLILVLPSGGADAG